MLLSPSPSQLSAPRLSAAPLCLQEEFLRKLAILIPPPKKNLIRYVGVFAPAHHARKAVVGLGGLRESGGNDHKPPPRHIRALPWAELLRRVFAIDILKCEKCGGDMKIIAVLPASEITEKILDHLGIDMGEAQATGPPPTASAA